ncbi:MAG: hypothetical protein ACP5FK_10135 [bacterium]
MLRRYQVMLHEWQEKFIQEYADLYDLSISEVLRALTCMGMIGLANETFADYKPTYSFAELVKDTKEVLDGKETTDIHIILSQLYFETRKAYEHHLKNEIVKKPAKKKS